MIGIGTALTSPLVMGTPAVSGGGDPPDVTAPVLQSAIIAADGLTTALLYDEALEPTSVLAAGGWTLNGTDAAVDSVGVSGSTVTLTHDAPVFASETVTITTSGAPVEDLAGNAAATLTAQATTNGSTVDLLSVAQSLGAVLLLDAITESARVLSGSDVTSVVNRITGTSISAAGTPQYSATSFNGGPGITFNGTTDWFIGTEAAVIAAMTNNNPYTLIMTVDCAVADAAGWFFGVGNSGQAINQWHAVGQTTTGDGRWIDRSINDAGTNAQLITAAGGGINDADTDPHLIELVGGTTSALKFERVVCSINGTTHNPGTLTPNQWGWGCKPDQTPDGGAFTSSLALLFPAALSAGDLDTLYAAIAAHRASLASLVP